MEKPLILICNDDGITAPGIRALIQMMNTLGDVYVVAPDSPQSGMGHAVTIDSTLHVQQVNIDAGPQKEWSCSGTPVDCVKLAIDQLLPRKPDLCVSGINHGSNAAINVIYSGTMSAAVEAGIQGIPAIGFSLLDFSWGADFTSSAYFVKKIAQKTLEQKLPEGVVLNVNIPKLKQNEINGIRVCRQANAVWREAFDRRINPKGQTYYWLTGVFENLDPHKDTDQAFLEEGYITIVPTQFDLTAYKALETLSNWKW